MASEECPGHGMKNCREDLKKCINTMIKKTTGFWFVGILITFILVVTGGIIATENKQNKDIAKIEVIQNDITHIKMAQEEMKVEFKDYVKEQKKESKESQKVILKAIEDLKKGN